MAGGVLTNVVKGVMLANADERLRQRTDKGETADDYRKRLKELSTWFEQGKAHHEHAKTMTTEGKDQLVATSPGHVIHAKDEFFGDGAQAYFPSMLGDTEDEIVRGGYMKAIELALAANPPKPIVSYWIINGLGPSDAEAFQVFVSDTPLQVHVLISTPLPANDRRKAPDDPNRALVENMFVVNRTQGIDLIVSRYGSGYPIHRKAVPGTTGIECLQVVGYV